MNSTCLDFRARLAQALDVRVQPEGSSPFVARAAAHLEWQAHVLTCGDCRALLEAEQALEHVLASLPQPSLPPDLVGRVLERLQPQRVDVALDRLLDRALDARSSGVAAAPVDLARSMLARLASARESAASERRTTLAVDALLDEAPAPQTPVGLAARVLARLEAERGRTIHAPKRAAAAVKAPSSVARAPRPRSTRFQPWLVAAGIAVFVGAAAWFWSRTGAVADRKDLGGPGRDMANNEPSQQLAPRLVDPVPAPPNAPRRVETLDASEPDPELLAQLDLLEAWDLLGDEALELELLGVNEDILLGLQSPGYETDGADEPAPDAPKSASGEVRNG